MYIYEDYLIKIIRVPEVFENYIGRENEGGENYEIQN